MEKLDTAQVISVLAASYPNWSVTEATIEVYHELLGDLDGDLVKKAARDWAMAEKWPPTVADLRSMVAEMSGYLPPAPEQAWSEVMSVIRVYGSSRKIPEWSHEAVAQAVNCIGYRNICASEKVEVVRAQFLKAYDGYRARSSRETITSYALSAGIKHWAIASVLKSLDAGE